MLLRSGYRFLMLIGILGASFVAASGYTFLDDEEPEVTDRVARVSAISGEVKIRRAESDEWERVVLNLPIVEGDEVVTENNSRVELQFTSKKHFRLDENTSIKVVTLADDGIALSVSQGNISTTLTDFNSQDGYFEIDAPKTTVALLASGQYRIDAGNSADSEVTVSVGNEGEARVYSATSGFTLRNGRSAKVIITGDRAGDWETGHSSMFGDSFGNWVNGREDTVARLVKNAYYDQYYDQDIYGAEDLNENGDWIHTPDYGYVWRPYSSSTSSYADWSPYRYGQWRWIPPYGWTWVNDEPWGWATYHHGRWIWYNNYWHWSPYGYYRNSRSWWRPALVYITVYNNNVCWYPLPYYHSYYNYNWHYYAKRPRHHGSGNGGNTREPKGPRTIRPTVPGTTTPNQPTNPGPTRDERMTRKLTPPLQSVPSTGVVSVPSDQFGSRKVPTRPPLTTAREILTKSPTEKQTPPVIPIFAETKPRIDAGTRVERPEISKKPIRPEVGAEKRSSTKPLDSELQRTRILGNRPKLENTPGMPTPRTDTRTVEPRKTGAVERPVRVNTDKRPSDTSVPVVRQPVTPVTRPTVPRESKPSTTDRTPSRPSTGFPQQQRERPQYTPQPSQPRPPSTNSRPSAPAEKPRSAPPTVSRPSAPAEKPRSAPAPSKPAESPKTESRPSRPASGTKKDG